MLGDDEHGGDAVDHLSAISQRDTDRLQVYPGGPICGQPAQQERCRTSRLKVWAVSFKPSTSVR